MKVLAFDSEAAWLEARRSFVTATMIARIAESRSSWKHVWAERGTGQSTFRGSRATEWGKEREKTIALWAQIHIDDGAKLVHTDDLYVADDGISAASPDMVAAPGVAERIGGEIKTVSKNRAWHVPEGATQDEIRRIIPGLYYDQIQWNCFVEELDLVLLIWEIHQDFDANTVEYGWCYVHRDEARIAELQALRDEFLAGDWRAPIEDEAELSFLIEEYHRYGAEIDERKTAQSRLKDKMLELLEVGSSFSCEAGSVSVQAPRKSKRLNQEALRAAHPDVFAEFYELSAPRSDVPIVAVRKAVKKNAQ